jgi:glutaminyl-tRNA synthetase
MSKERDETEGDDAPHNFIHSIVEADLAAGKNDRRVVTRFPPEPNGYLHIGHAKAIWLNFELAERFGGRCNLRFDDTNPSAEESEFVDSIAEDVRWLGYRWSGDILFTSSYFETLYAYALRLVAKGAAYVCDLSVDETREYRGSGAAPGRTSPFRDRTPEENRELLERMRAGEFADGARTLRAKIDMASPNMNLRDPVMYRIMRHHHHRTGDAWCIYPMYDWAHGQSDAIEGITHSVCTLEFENHRPLYDWFLEQLELPHRPRQLEFARLNLTYTILSKRYLKQLVKDGHVSGWDDPRMPTVSGFRRRGYTPEAIRRFCEGIGVAKFNSTVDMVVLENALRDDLNARAPRRLGVLRPVRLVIENYPEGESEEFDAVNNPEDENAGTRRVPFSRELWVDADDFREDAPRKWFRLAPGQEVRLRYACYVTCTGFDKDPASGEVTEIRCTFDPESRGASTPDGRKVKGTIHWVSAAHAIDAEVRLYDHLFGVPFPGDVEEGGHFSDHLNPSSLEVVRAKLEPSLADVAPGQPFQLERHGYFTADPVDSNPGALVLNRSVALRDSWARLEKNLQTQG